MERPPMKSTHEGSNHSIDWESLSLSLLFRSAKIAADSKSHAADAVHRLFPQLVGPQAVCSSIRSCLHMLWRRAQRQLRKSEEEELKSLLYPAVPVLAPSRELMTLVEDNLEDLKAQMQLLLAFVDEVKQMQQQAHAELRRLQDQVMKMAKCTCDPQEAALRRSLFAARVVDTTSIAERPAPRVRRMELPLL